MKYARAAISTATALFLTAAAQRNAEAQPSAGGSAPAIHAVRQPNCLSAGATIEIVGEHLPQSAFLASPTDKRRATRLTTMSSSARQLRLAAPANAHLRGDTVFALWLDGADRPLRLIETCRSYEPHSAGAGSGFEFGGLLGGEAGKLSPRRSTHSRARAPSRAPRGGLAPSVTLRIPFGGDGRRPDGRSRRADSNGDGLIDNEVIAYYDADADAARGAMLAAGLGYVVVSDVPLLRLGGVLITYRTPRGTSSTAGAAQLRALDPRGLYDANGVLRPSQGRAKSRALGRTYWPQMLGWRRSDSCRPLAPIGVIDTIIDTRHRAFAHAQITQGLFLKNGETQASPEHGTAVAGLLVGGEAAGGLFSSGRIYAASVAEQSSSPFVRTDRAAAALDWIAQRGVRLVNISLTGPYNAVLARKVQSAAAIGMIIVAAAGNGGPSARPAYPAAYEDVIAVTAVDANRSLYARANLGAYIDVAAPGVDIWAPRDGNRMWYFTGTSAAAPFVTARIAADPLPNGATAAQRVRTLLRRNAADLGPAGVDTQFGAGLINSPPTCR